MIFKQLMRYQSIAQERGSYTNFCSTIRSYEKSGIFPIGLNIPDKSGVPKYPEIESHLLGGNDFTKYYKVCNRMFSSMQSASFFYSRSHGSIQNLFKKWIREFESKKTPLPKGFNVYDTRTQKPLYPRL